MRITILGSGSAYGTPNVFNAWGGIKNKDNKKNIRTRASSFIELDGKSILVDLTPEFRSQINDNNITNIDAVFLTHGHYDHICAVPELWRAAHILQKQIHVFCHQSTYDEIKTCFPYFFKDSKEKGAGGAVWNVFCDNETFEFEGLQWQTFQVKHGRLTTSVFRHKDIAIVMDLEMLAIDQKQKLKDLELLIVECNNGLKPLSNGHTDWHQISNWLKEIKPKQTILTHISNQVDHDELSQALPDNVAVAYDGMIINLP